MKIHKYLNENFRLFFNLPLPAPPPPPPETEVEDDVVDVLLPPPPIEEESPDEESPIETDGGVTDEGLLIYDFITLGMVKVC